MTTFQIEPHIGVGPVKLGMTRDQVHHALGTPERSRNEREGFLGGFFVDFDSSDRVEFIELARSNQFEALFDGVCLHQVEADVALRVVGKFDQFDKGNRELGHSYIFLNLQMSLWRGTMPEPDQDLGDPDGRFFEAVGIAADGYFTAGK